ncbi:MAG TPA: type II toxin-antitoxin system HicB family antitoxin [Puia sp.]|nr:type II toxin-antitoxin system HicB family antitoxin [Puia sp.]
MSDLLTYKGYFGSARYSAADEVFYGKLEGIDDLVNYEASSVKELIKAFHEAVEDYLETCQRIGKEPNKTYKGSFNVRIPAEMHREAAIYAASADISLNDFVKTAIEYALLNKRILQSDLSPAHSLQVAEEAAPYQRTTNHKKAAGRSKKAASASTRAGTRKKKK